MKATELMIGDWVFYIGDGEPKKRKVLEITALKQVELFDGKDWSSWFLVGEKYIEPIPLTPEILEKNGFTRYGQVYANLQQWVGKFGDKRKSFVQDIRTGEWGMNDVWINYVHELQHVLKLCGIEKEIVL